MQRSSQPIEIKFLPPLLDETKNIERKIICVRPMREGRPNISAEKIGTQLHINNYGHGGSGWTLLWGSIDHAVELYRQALSQNPDYKNKPIVIIGAGVMGLGCAAKLAQLQAEHPELGIGPIKVVAEKIEDITSYNAAGLWAQVSMQNDPEGQELVNELGKKSFLKYLQIACGKDENFSSAAAELQPYFVNPGIESGVDTLVEDGIIPPPVAVVADFGTQKHDVLLYQSIYINTFVFMRCFHDVLKKYNVPIENKRVKDFAELGNVVVFDCAGLGTRELKNDKQMIGVFGHILTLKNQPPAFLNTDLTNKNNSSLAPDVLQSKLKMLTTYVMHLFKRGPRRQRLLSQLNYMRDSKDGMWFKDAETHVQFITDLAQLIHRVKRQYPDEVQDAMDVYASIIPRNNTRYMFMVKGKFNYPENIANPNSSQDECTYFMVTSEKLPKSILSANPGAEAVVAGKVGGTFIPANKFDATTSEQEFSKMLYRMKSVCYGPGFFSGKTTSHSVPDVARSKKSCP